MFVGVVEDACWHGPERGCPFGAFGGGEVAIEEVVRVDGERHVVFLVGGRGRRSKLKNFFLFFSFFSEFVLFL